MMYYCDDERGFLIKERLGLGETIIWLMWLLAFSIYFIGLGLLIFYPVYHKTGQYLLILWILLVNVMGLIHANSGVVNLIETIHTPLTQTIFSLIVCLSMFLAGFFLLMLSAGFGFTFGNIIILWFTISGMVGAIHCRRVYQQYLNYYF